MLQYEDDDDDRVYIYIQIFFLHIYTSIYIVSMTMDDDFSDGGEFIASSFSASCMLSLLLAARRAPSLSSVCCFSNTLLLLDLLIFCVPLHSSNLIFYIFFIQPTSPSSPSTFLYSSLFLLT